MLRVAIIIGTTRPNRKSEQVARWVHSITSQRSEVEFELLDLCDWNLPLYEDRTSPRAGSTHTRIPKQGRIKCFI